MIKQQFSIVVSPNLVQDCYSPVDWQFIIDWHAG